MGELIKHSLGLAINIIDTTTGKHFGDISTEFIFDRSDIMHPVSKGEGTFIILNYCRENFHMQIRHKGYENYDVDVDYELLDKRLPMLNVFMIPTDLNGLKDDVISLKGKLPGISEIMLVRMTDIRAHTDAYDAKKRILTVFEKGNRLNMEGSPFGIIGPAKDAFEVIDITDQCGDNKVILRNPLMEEFFRNAPISRVTYGYVDSKDNYTIAVRNDGADLRAILRYKIGEEIRFMKVDFTNLEEIALS